MRRWIALSTLLSFGLLSPNAQAFHFPWDQNHDTTFPLNPEDRDGPPFDSDSCGGGNGETGSPVYLANGNLVWSEVDVFLAGTMPLTLSRTYNSNDPKDGPFGKGWTFNYESTLIVGDPQQAKARGNLSGASVVGSCTLVNGMGRRLHFAQEGDNFTALGKRFHASLSATNNEHTLTMQDGQSNHYSQSGKLVQRTDRAGNQLILSYDDQDRLSQIASPFGQSLDFSYNTAGRVDTVTDHAERSWIYSYDASGQLTAITDPSGATTSYRYQTYQAPGDGQSVSQLIRIIDSTDVQTLAVTYDGNRVSSYTAGENTYSYTYNARNNTVTKTDSQRSRWIYTLDEQGQYTTVSAPLNRRTTYVREERGYVTSITDPLGLVVTFVIDEHGRITQTDDGRKTITFKYTGVRPEPSSVATGDRTGTFTYDSNGLLLTATDAAGHQIQMTRDEYGRVVQHLDPLGNSTTLRYNDQGFLQSQTNAMGDTETYERDALGRVTVLNDRLGNRFTLAYDLMGRITETVDAEGNRTRFSYDSEGRLLSVTTANNATESYSYDDFGRLTQIAHFDGSVSTNTYASDNTLSTQTAPNGVVTTLTYNTAKEITRISTGSLSKSFSYDGRGDLLTASGGTPSVRWTYDSFGRSTTERSGGRTNTYNYNEYDELVSLTTPENDTINYSYDARGLLESMDGPAGEFDFEWDAVGRLVRVQHPNGVRLDNNYDAIHRLVTRTYSGTFSKSWDYRYNAGGLITDITEDSTDQNYSYDDSYRLLRASTPAGIFDYSYDSVGNIINDAQRYNIANLLLSNTNETFEYDPNGNLVRRLNTADGSSTQYTYNDRDELTQVQTFVAGDPNPTNTVTYRYDTMGRRSTTVVNGDRTNYHWDGSRLVAEYQGSTRSAQYIQGPGFAPWAVRQDDTNHYIVSNHLATPVALIDSSANPVFSNQLTPFGQQVSNSGTARQNIRLPGQYADEITGLHYNHHRYYEPSLGRYIQSDPIGIAGGINSYVYALNNPISNTDSKGLFLDTVSDIVSLAFGINSFAHNINCGNYGSAAMDFAGILLDGVALALPGVPGGAGYGLKGARAAARGADAIGPLGRVARHTPGCFLEGTSVATETETVAIETIRVGERVRTISGESSLHSENTSWVRLRLVLETAQATYNIEALKPPAWLKANGVEVVSDQVPLQLPELGVAGLAEIRDIEPEFTIDTGPGRLVLMTINHLNNDVYEVGFGDGVASLRGTGLHPLYSLDRDDWVRVRDLRIGERLQTAEGAISIASLEKVRGLHRVYNLEVEGAHEYLVGDAQVRAHNMCAWSPGKQLWNKGKLKTHFTKHGAEVGATSASDYTKRAVEFATAPNEGGRFIDITKDAFFYRFEPATNKIFVGTTAGQKIKTFYQWDGRVDDVVIKTLQGAGLF